ncbi:energy-coupling factor ABC transporter permease [Lachnospiraceae bacterium 29-84]
MHMADALVAPAVAGTMYACSAAAAAYSIRKVRLEDAPEKTPVMGVMGAFVFAAQMINFTIPGTGSSGHLCGGMLLTAVLGPYASFLAMIGVLLIQCLLFADGGLLALGCNIWNMAFYGCFLGYFLVWRPIRRNGLSKPKVLAASILGSVLTLQLGAFSVSLETMASGITELPFVAFVSTMQPIHLAIGLMEGLITAAVLMFVYHARPELLSGERETEGRLSFPKTMAVLCVATLLLGGGLSLAASANPDGLEWSMERLAGTAELEAKEADVHTVAGQIQEKTALLPDYGFQGSSPDHERWGTSVSGVVGSLAVLAFCGVVCYAFRFFRRKETHGQA